MKKPQIGAVIEFKTNKGLAYGIYTHKNDEYGELLRLLDGFYEVRPQEWQKVVSCNVRFSAFFPLRAAISRGIVSAVADAIVPEQLRPFPMFRCGVYDPDKNSVAQWWLWDGEREWSVPSLSPEEWSYPIRGIWNDTLVIHRLEEGYVEDRALF